jgi:hypothetical protein
MTTLPLPGAARKPAAPVPVEVLRREAGLLRNAGLGLCRVAPGRKQPTYRGWTTRSLEPGDFDAGDGLGVLTGALSNGGRSGCSLVGVDLDDPGAVARADTFLPGTGLVEGRPGKPRSHRFFLAPNDTIPDGAVSRAPQAAAAAVLSAGHPGPRTQSFLHRDTRAELVRLCGTGAQLVVAPSQHPSGEQRAWDRRAAPAVLPHGELLDAVTRQHRGAPGQGTRWSAH